jgi:hypothetical protein
MDMWCSEERLDRAIGKLRAQPKWESDVTVSYSGVMDSFTMLLDELRNAPNLKPLFFFAMTVLLCLALSLHHTHLCQFYPFISCQLLRLLC